MMSSSRRRFARRVALGLMILAAVLATCAIMFHRMHDVALDEAREILELEIQRRAILTATWLEARQDAFRDFARAVPVEQTLKPNASDALLAALRHRDPTFTDLAVVDGTGKILSGSTRASARHDAFPWLRGASGDAEYRGGIYPGPDGAVRVFHSRRLTTEGFGMHLRAETDARDLFETIAEGDVEAAWFLLDGRGAALPLGGVTAPEAALTALGMYEKSDGQAISKRTEAKLLAAAAPLPGFATENAPGPGLAVVVDEPQTPYKDLGLALTVLAAACLAYAGYVRARVLKR